MLKQPQYKPMPMEEQVVSIFAATPPEGRDSWVRPYENEDLGRYEEEMLSFMRSRHEDLLASIRASGVLSDEDRDKLVAALDEFANHFEPTHKTEAA